MDLLIALSVHYGEHGECRGVRLTDDEGECQIRAVIVDDHTLFAEAIRPTLEHHGIQVEAVVTSGAAGLDAVREHRPDIVLVDIGLPDRSGLAVGADILAAWPETKVLALTALNDPRAVKEAMRAGFHGYLTKDTPIAKFVEAVLATLGGQVVLPHRLAAQAAGARSGHEREVAMMASQLTYREIDVLGLLVEGVPGDAIARRLGISPNTVRTHVQSILSKLQVHSRLEAATFAVRYGIVDPPRSRNAI